jgi:DNA-binding ferritin-like protein (Dps family)
MLERVNALPEEYRYVYEKIQGYMWMSSGGSGVGTIPILADLLDLFEMGVAEGKRVLEITGEDVAAFCDELLRNARTSTQNRRDEPLAYRQNQREALNRDIMGELRKGKGSK